MLKEVKPLRRTPRWGPTAARLPASTHDDEVGWPDHHITTAVCQSASLQSPTQDLLAHPYPRRAAYWLRSPRYRNMGGGPCLGENSG